MRTRARSKRPWTQLLFTTMWILLIVLQIWCGFFLTIHLLGLCQDCLGTRAGDGDADDYDTCHDDDDD
jgi:hypothetical protein